MRWQQAKEILRESLSESTFSLWIEPLRCAQATDEKVVLEGPDRFFCSWVQDNYMERIQQAMQNGAERTIAVSFAVDASGRPCSAAIVPMNSEGASQMRLPSIPLKCSSVRTLHPRYTFDEFMVGECNALARNACESLANGDTRLGRYLYIGGGTGLGKSHLSHAVAHHVTMHFPQTRIQYLTARQLTGELVKALRSNAMEGFKDRFHKQCDILLLDDVHTLTGRVKTQEELEAALDVLMETGKRIIFTGAMAPKDIPDMDARVRSRLSAGLITQVSTPDVETRVRIITHKAKGKNLELPEELVLYMAEHLTGDIRQIESAVVGLKAKCSLKRVLPDLDMVREVLAGIVSQQNSALTAEIIRDFLARQFKISSEDMQSKSRKKSIAFPRQMSMYLSRKMTDQPLVDIGRAFNRDHSTVIHAIRVITESIARSASVRGQVDLLGKRLQQKYR